MAIIYFTGGQEDEQALGGVQNNGVVQMYAVRRDDPLNLIYLGGHRMDDAPSYNITEGKILMQYKFLGGRNTVVEKQITSDIVKGVTFNILPPSRVLSVTDRIYQMQSKCEYDLVFIPADCVSGCDSYFMIGEDMKLGTRQFTNTVVGYDDNEAPITTTRTAKVTGQLRSFHGLEVRQLADAAEPLYAVVVADDTNSRCAGCGCPYQIIYRGGGDGVDTPYLQTSADGGQTWSSVTVTPTVAATEIITSLLYSDGRLIMGFSDVVDGVGTMGGVAYIDSAGTVTEATGLTSTGVQALVKAGSKIYAAGTAGQLWVSEDNGLSFSAVTTGITTTITSMAYDKSTGNLFLGATASEVWVYNGLSFVDLTADVGVTAATVVTDVKSPAPDQVIVFAADGTIYENFSFSAGGAWAQTADLGASSVGAVGDMFNYRVLASAGNAVYVRDLLTYQSFDELTSFTGDVTAGYAPAPLLEEGNNFFIFVTDTGESAIVSSCGICLE